MKRLLIILEIFVLLFLLYWHFKLGLVRYFDGDEFTHLHWGYSLSIGERPYTDFFYLFPPFFLYPVAALFKIFGRVPAVLINARMFMFFVFLSTSGVLFLLVKKMRGIQAALLTVIIFAFLPLPFDKMIEIRPDLLATFLALAGMYLFLREKYFFSALFYAISLGFVPKTIFFLIPPVSILLYKQYKLLAKSRISKTAVLFFAGFVPVILTLLFLIWSFGDFSFAFYSMTNMAAVITKTLGAKFYMRPDIFFYPNDTYYGSGGWSTSLVINLIIYISASVWAIHRFLTFNLGGDKGNEGNNSLGEFLIAGTFWANLIAFVNFYPLKHAQYLIPLTPFIAFYFADLWEAILNKSPKSLKLLKIGATIILLFFLSWVGWQMNQKKLTWVNTVTFDKLNYWLTNIPANAAVFDLTGESVFFKNGYYFCCLPYGQYEESLYFKLPDIKQDFERRGTKYVQLGAVERLNTIPPLHARYIIENFTAIVPDKTLLIKKQQ